MNSWTARRSIEFLGTPSFGSWLLKLYRVSAMAQLRQQEVQNIMTKCVAGLKPDPDYHTFQRGVACVHFGRRGVAVMLAHFGLWGDMFEVFLQGWYRETGKNETFEPLQSTDPVMSYHDAPLLLAEINLARSYASIVANTSSIQWEAAMDEYVRSEPAIQLTDS